MNRTQFVLTVLMVVLVAFTFSMIGGNFSDEEKVMRVVLNKTVPVFLGFLALIYVFRNKR